MEKNIKEVVYSTTFYDDFKSIYLFGYETFGQSLADMFAQKITQLTRGLSHEFLIYAECRHLETKNQIYRNIISDNYLIIYRIRSKRIAALRILHGSQSTSKIKSSKKIKIT